MGQGRLLLRRSDRCMQLGVRDPRPQCSGPGHSLWLWVMEMLLKAGAPLPGGIRGLACTCCVPVLGLPRLPSEAPLCSDVGHACCCFLGWRGLETVAEFCELLGAGGMVTRLGNSGLAVRCREVGLSGLWTSPPSFPCLPSYPEPWILRGREGWGWE